MLQDTAACRHAEVIALGGRYRVRRASPSASAAARPGPESKPAASPKSVAVLAFDNLSDDKSSEYFSDGISEELLTVLQKIPGLRVAARILPRAT